MAGKKTAEPPVWTPALLMAKEFGIPPWQIERECTLEWLHRWMSYKQAENMEQERLEKKRGKRAN